MDMHLVKELGDDIAQEPIRAGFGRGLLLAAQQDARVVGLCADLTDSTKMNDFADAFPDRFVDVGVAEQNLVTVASGLAAMGKIPFASSYAVFCAGALLGANSHHNLFKRPTGKNCRLACGH